VATLDTVTVLVRIGARHSTHARIDGGCHHLTLTCGGFMAVCACVCACASVARGCALHVASSEYARTGTVGTDAIQTQHGPTHEDDDDDDDADATDAQPHDCSRGSTFCLPRLMSSPFVLSSAPLSVCPGCCLSVQRVRLNALECLSYLRVLPYDQLHPFRSSILLTLAATVDDHKRLVRQVAAKARNKWYIMAE
jgi:hypothetical protein